MARDSSHDHHSSSHVKHESEDSMPSTSDFVKKLYKMLEDTSFADVVSWGPHGDCFVVKDMNEFTKSILPRMFKHSNFASFVRQLNKYDFHKVKNTDDNQFGEHSWTFRHPDFHADRRDALENIKRKVPAARKSTGRGANSPSPASNATVEALQSQIDRMARDQEEMAAHIRSLETNYQNVLSEMVNFQRNMAQQDGLMQNLIQYFLQLENGKVKTEQLSNPAPGTYAPDPNPFLPATEAQRMMGAYPDGDIARASLAQMNEISRRAEVAGMTFTTSGNAGGPPRPSSRASTIMAAAAGLMPGGVDAPARPMSRQDALARIEELTRMRPTPSLDPTQTQNAGQAQTQAQAAPSSSPASQKARPQAAPAAQQSSPSASSPPQQQQQNAGPSSQTLDAAPFDPTAFLLEDAARYGLSVDPNTLNHEGLQVFTVGHLLPRSSLEDANGNWAFDPNALSQAVVMPTPEGMGGDPEEEGESSTSPSATAVQPTQFISAPTPSAAPGSTPSMGAPGAAGTASAGPSTRPGSAQTLRVRRSTYVPGWAVPPRVLLVDDDAVSRKVSSKFLQIFGCTIDVAVDGVGAVNKMNLEKYDLVLMDIVMPKLDGVSATSLIRQFDHMTPIISMTSNSKPAEIMKYYSSGMNDHLPKPFTQHGLWEVLEKHLTHLKVIQTLSRVPRSVGVPPLSDPSFDNALAVQVQAQAMGALPLGFSLGGEDEDGKINPLAGMGLTDEQYTLILQNLVNGESFSGVSSLEGANGSGGGGGGESSKRQLDDAGDGRESKRSRFEVIE
ncbi:HSF-type DNA-binding-domain-containing protein [Trametes maxima]|nr:HSF-type DNA-binding-domain-containing protein [Trametes maxima]